MHPALGSGRTEDMTSHYGIHAQAGSCCIHLMSVLRCVMGLEEAPETHTAAGRRRSARNPSLSTARAGRGTDEVLQIVASV